MAISLTTLNGTDSIASARITINDNFSTLGSALNSVLSILDIATGFIDNTSYGSNNNIRTESITATTGITISSGNLTISNGNAVLSGSIQLGSGTNVNIKKNLHNLTSGTIYTLDVSGSTGITGSTPVGALVIPRLSTASYTDIRTPELGSIVYDISTDKLMVCTGTTSIAGATGTWTIIGSQS
jgi:hypothetical protein